MVEELLRRGGRPEVRARTVACFDPGAHHSGPFGGAVEQPSTPMTAPHRGNAAPGGHPHPGRRDKGTAAQCDRVGRTVALGFKLGKGKLQLVPHWHPVSAVEAGGRIPTHRIFTRPAAALARDS